MLQIRILGIANLNRYDVQQDFFDDSTWHKEETTKYLNSNPDGNLHSISFMLGAICSCILQLHFTGRWAPGALKIGATWYVIFGVNVSYGSLKFTWIAVTKFALSGNLDMRPS